MNYSVQYGQTIYDIALATYGSSEYVLKIIQDNPFIENVDYDFNANPGAVISWDDSLVAVVPPDLTADTEEDDSDSASIVATDGQSIYDICLMTYGDLKYLYKLLQDNNIVSLNNTLISGKKFTFTPSLIQDTGFYNYLFNGGKVINTLESTNGKAYNKSFNISFH